MYILQQHRPYWFFWKWRFFFFFPPGMKAAGLLCLCSVIFGCTVMIVLWVRTFQRLFLSFPLDAYSIWMWTDPRMLLGLRSHQACFCNPGVFNPTVQSVWVGLNTVRDHRCKLNSWTLLHLKGMVSDRFITGGLHHLCKYSPHKSD